MANTTRASRAADTLCGNRQHRPVDLFREVRVAGDLVGGRAPLLNAADRETGCNQGVQCRAERTVILDDALGEPVGDTLSLDRVAVEQPDAAALGVRGPARVRRGHVDRVFDGEDEMRSGQEFLWIVRTNRSKSSM